MSIIIAYYCVLYMYLALSTELDCLWNKNTAFLLYNQLSDHGKLKLFAHMINRYNNS